VARRAPEIYGGRIIAVLYLLGLLGVTFGFMCLDGEPDLEILLICLPALATHVIATLMLFPTPSLLGPWVVGVFITTPVVVAAGVMMASTFEGSATSGLAVFMFNLVQSFYLGPVLGSGVALGFARNWLPPTADSQR